MAQNLTIGVFAVFVLGLVTVFTTRVRKYHRVVLGLFKLATIAQILRKFAFCVRCITVGTCPVVHIKFPTLFIALFFFRFFAQMVFHYTSLLFFLLILANVLFQAFIELFDPAFNAPKVEGLTALLTVPEVAFLVDWVVADHAVL